MSYLKPQLTTPSSLIFAILNGGSNFGGSGITTWKTRGKYSPSDLAGGGDAWLRFGLAYSSTACSFLMISPNLHDIWAMFFLILSRYEKRVLLMLLRTSGDGYSL